MPLFVVYNQTEKSYRLPVTEGTVFRLSVQRPGEEKEVRTSIAINESDLELIELLKSMARK